MSLLRAIAVSVEERKPEQFSWVLIERSGDTWHPLDDAPVPVPSYQRAMAEGLLALQELVEDLDRGPRAAANPSPSRPGQTARQRVRGKGPANKESDARTKPTADSLYFGFGPAR